MSRPEAPEPLPSPVVDNHCHLDIQWDRGEDLSADDALALARSVNVTQIVQIGCDVKGAQWAVEAASRYDAVVAGVALHPNLAARLVERGGLADLDDAWATIEELASHPQVRAVGETGLDFYRTGPEGRPAQEESFRRHIDLAKRLNKTLVIHDRDAHAEVLAVLDAETPPERWVMHCFSGDAAFARDCLDRGAFLSFAGPLTYPANTHLREALAVTPDHRFLAETDAPYLTPVPMRGRRNASYLLPHTVRHMAEIRGQSLIEVCEQIDDATSAAFGGPW